MRQLKKKGSNKIIKVDPSNKYTVCEDLEHQLGKVDNIYIVASSGNHIHGKSLKELAKQRVKARSDPSFTDLKEYTELRQSCWVIEECNGQFYCDCPIGMKVIMSDIPY